VRLTQCVHISGRLRPSGTNRKHAIRAPFPISVGGENFPQLVGETELAIRLFQQTDFTCRITGVEDLRKPIDLAQNCTAIAISQSGTGSSHYEVQRCPNDAFILEVVSL